MKVTIWDKKSNINGLTPTQFMNASKNWLQKDTVVVIGYEVSQEHTATADDIQTVRHILAMPNEETEVVVAAWEAYLNRPSEQPMNETEQRLADIEAAISELTYGGETV